MSAELSDDDLDLLADVLAGEATEADFERVHTSARLTQALVELERADAAVQSELAALAEVRLEPPSGLDARLRAALAELDAPRLQRVRPLAAVRMARAARTGEPRLLRAVASLAGLIVLAGIGVAVTQGSDESGPDTNALDTVASGPQQASPFAADVPSRASGRDYARPGALRRALPFLLAGGNKSGADAALSGGSADQPAPQFPVPLRLPAAPQFPAPLQQLPAAPDRPSGSTGGSSTGSASTGGAAVPGRVQALSTSTLNRLRNPTARQACFTALGLGPATMPEALDFARYAGQPALVIVLGVPDEPSALAVFVVGPACGQGTGALLFSGRFDRP